MANASHSKTGIPMVLAIDGPDCAGKSTLAEQLSLAWPKPSKIVGTDSLISLKDEEILCLKGPRDFIRIFDSKTLATRIDSLVQMSDPGRFDLIVVEGLFLCRQPAIKRFNSVIRLEISEDEVLRRALVRDLERFGSRKAILEHYNRHCLPAQRIYRREFLRRNPVWAVFELDSED